MKFPKALVTIRGMRLEGGAAVTRMMNELSGSGKLTKAFLLRHCLGRRSTMRAGVASKAERIIGFVITSDWANLNHGYIDSTLDFLFIEKKFQGLGLGTKLAKRAAKEAVKRGCKWFRTSTSPHQKEAHRLYNRLGFVRRSYKPNIYLMEGPALLNFIEDTNHETSFKK